MSALFRFRGNTPPKAGARASVLALAPRSDDTTDGVATMRVYDPIDSWGGDWGVSAKEFAAALDALPGDVHTIELHLNSPGGEVYEGIAITNMLRQHKARVVAVVDGLAASAASFIATAADETIMSPNSQLMIHDAWGLCVGNAADMRDLAGNLDKISDNIAAVYAAKAGGDVATWRAAMLAETWYSDDEAVAAGLADKVSTSAPPADAAKAAVDLSVFRYAGRDVAPDPTVPVPAAAAAVVDEQDEQPTDASSRETRQRRARLRAAAAKSGRR